MLSSIWHSKESKVNSLWLEGNEPKTESIQTFASQVSIHVFAEVATTACCLNFWVEGGIVVPVKYSALTTKLCLLNSGEGA